MHSFPRTLFVEGGRTPFIGKFRGTPFINGGGHHSSGEGAILHGRESFTNEGTPFINKGGRELFFKGGRAVHQ